MYEKKSLIITSLASLIIGLLLGSTGFWYCTVELPHKKAVALAKQQQEELNSMLRIGQVLSVKPDEFILRIEEGGVPGQVGKEVTYKIDSGTKIQKGPYIINPHGEMPDLTKIISVGKTLRLLVKGDKIVTLHWDTQPIQ